MLHFCDAANVRRSPDVARGQRLQWMIGKSIAMSPYLAGPSGRFVTGETLTVDGGGQLWSETWTTGKPSYFNSEDT